MKHCPSCNTDKQRDEFGDNRARPDGKQSECKPCRAAYARHYRECYPLKVAATKKRYRMRKKG